MNVHNKNISWLFLCFVLIFTLCVIVDNFLEIKCITLFGMSTTPGLLVIPISYIVGDTVTEVYGFKFARRMIGIAFAANLFFIGILQIACLIPPADYWTGEEHFQYIFGTAPRMMICGMAAFVSGNLMNSYIMHWMKQHCPRYGFKTRAIISTIFGEFADSTTFYFPAFWGVLPLDVIIQLCVMSSIAKICYEVMILPITTRVVKYAKNVEYSV